MVIKAISCIPFPSQVAFMPYRVNGQYIMEGLASSFLFSMGGLGFIILDKSNAVGMSKLNRFLLLFLGFVCVLVSFFTCRVFMRMKLPWVSLVFFYLLLDLLVNAYSLLTPCSWSRVQTVCTPPPFPSSLPHRGLIA